MPEANKLPNVNYDKVMKDIRTAAKDRKLLNFSYRRRTGEIKQYTVEPYSFRPGKQGEMLCGYDVNSDRTKKFYLRAEENMDGIIFSEVSNVAYEPRNDWEVEID